MEFSTVLMGGFAVVALLLKMKGLYGVLSNAVERRRREMGLPDHARNRGRMVIHSRHPTLSFQAHPALERGSCFRLVPH
jgi:hypothetical protein